MLSVIIVTVKSAQFIENCLKSILDNVPTPEIEVIISDNASTDGTLAIIRDKFPLVKIIKNKQNLGFGAANNRGVAQSSGEYVLFLNDDTVVKPSALTKLVAFMDAHPDVGVVGPKLLNPDGTLQRSIVRYPSIWMDMLRALVPRQLEINTPITRFFVQRYSQLFGVKSLGTFSDHTCEIDVDGVLGACLLTRRAILGQVGSFDENIFLWCEEGELCYRIRKLNWRVVYYPNAEIVHFRGSTLGKIDDCAAKRVIVQKYKSLLYYYEKHTQVPNVLVYKIGILSIFVFRSLLLTLLILLSAPDKKRSRLAEREAFLAVVRVMLDSNFRKQNVYTEMKFKYLE